MKTLASDGGEWSASRPGGFTPRIGPPDTHWIGHSMDPKSRSGRGSEDRKFHHCPCQELNPCRPASSLVPILTELPQFLLKCLFSNIPTKSSRLPPSKSLHTSHDNITIDYALETAPLSKISMNRSSPLTCFGSEF